jgi:mannose-6-phosphate isomerase-like protein (cupin superfamily)
VNVVPHVCNFNDIRGKKVKEDDRYVVKDNDSLNNLMLSSTRLKAGCSTNGHSHILQEEIYFFHSGEGFIQVDDENFDVKKGSVVLIPDGAFHKVTNTHGEEDLYFICVFDGNRYDG